MRLKAAVENKMVVAWAISFAVILISIKLSIGMLISDDAYITLSHVKTWVQTGRPIMSIYNPVCATSTPLYTAILALLNFVSGIEPTHLAFGINSILDFANASLIYSAGRLLGMSRLFSAMAATLFGLSTLALGTSASGMETPLYIALTLSGYCLILSNSSGNIMGGVLFLLAMIRPEGIVVAVSIALFSRLRAWPLRATAWMFGSAMLGLSALLLFYFAAYGNIFPHSVMAKHAGMHTAYFDAVGFWWNTLFFGGPDYGGLHMTIVGNVLFVGLSMLGLIGAPWKRLLLIGHLLIGPLLYFGFFIFTRSSHPFFTWYYLPVMPFILIASCFGLQELSVRLKLYRWRTVGWIFLALFCGIVAYRNFAVDKIYLKFRKSHQEREGLYQQAAMYIAGASLPTANVMIEEVGTVGYYLPRHIYDLCGIISPEVLKHGLDGPAKFKEIFSPDWIIFSSDSLAESPQFISRNEYLLRLSLPHFNHNKFLQIWSKSSSLNLH